MASPRAIKARIKLNKGGGRKQYKGPRKSYFSTAGPLLMFLPICGIMGIMGVLLWFVVFVLLIKDIRRVNNEREV